jgi:hypothetical protein
MWNLEEDEIRAVVEDELERNTEDYSLGIDLDGEYLSISISYEGERPPFLGETLGEMTDSNSYHLRSDLDAENSSVTYTLEIVEEDEEGKDR